MTAETAHLSWFYGYDAESLIPPGLPPLWLAVRAGEEARHSLGEVAKGLLLHHMATRPQPVMLRAPQ